MTLDVFVALLFLALVLAALACPISPERAQTLRRFRYRANAWLVESVYPNERREA